MDLSQVYAQYLADEERTRQQNIVTAREYYEGDQKARLTERQEEYLGFNLSKERFAVNFCATVVDAPVERMIVDGFQTADDALSEWLWDVWKHNRMDAKQQQVHHGAINEGEFFVMVDWPEGAPFPRLLPHPRYTDPELGGTGFGCKAHYQNDDTNLPLEAVSKRWTESYQDERGRTRQRVRMNIYYPGRLERWVRSTDGQYKEAGWAPFSDDENKPVVAWADSAGEPLGIPFAHFSKPGRLELWDAISLQDLINKTALDIIATVDACGFPMRIAKGVTPTTDGKPPEDDGSNYLELFPGCWITIPLDGEVIFQPGNDPRPLVETLDSYIQKLAQVTDTPMSRFQMTRQVAAEGTLKQQDGPLLAKVRAYQTQIGNGWEDVFYAARAIANGQHGAGLNEDATLETQWEPAETRDEKQEMERLVMKSQLGVPREQLWSEMGYDADEIAAMRAMVGAELQETSNLGGALLEQFERGV